MVPIVYTESDGQTYNWSDLGDTIDRQEILELLGYDLSSMDIFQWAAARDVLIDYALPRLTGGYPGSLWKAAAADPEQAEALRKLIAQQGGIVQ